MKSNNKEIYVEVTSPQEGCASGKILEVINTWSNGSITGVDAYSVTDYTKHTISKGDYTLIELSEEEDGNGGV